MKQSKLDPVQAGDVEGSALRVAGGAVSGGSVSGQCVYCVVEPSRSLLRLSLLPSLDRLAGLIERVVELVDEVAGGTGGELEAPAPVALPPPAPPQVLEPVAPPPVSSHPRRAMPAAVAGWLAFVPSPNGYTLVPRPDRSRPGRRARARRCLFPRAPLRAVAAPRRPPPLRRGREGGTAGAGSNLRRVKEESQIDEMRAALRGDRERAEQSRQRSTENVLGLIEPRATRSRRSLSRSRSTAAVCWAACSAGSATVFRVRRRERERIMRQGVVLPETPRDRREPRGARGRYSRQPAARPGAGAAAAQLPAGRRRLPRLARRAAPVHGEAAGDRRAHGRARAAAGRSSTRRSAAKRRRGRRWRAGGTSAR